MQLPYNYQTTAHRPLETLEISGQEANDEDDKGLSTGVG